MRRRTLTLALVLLVGAGACEDALQQPPPQEDQSIVVITLNYVGAVPDLRQIRVAAHLGSAGLDADLYFPTTLSPQPIPSGATLALLIPTTRMGLLDLIVYGLDANQAPVARGNGQTTIVVGGRVDTTISLSPCAMPGCN